jgi:hypothetical protein
MRHRAMLALSCALAFAGCTTHPIEKPESQGQSETPVLIDLTLERNVDLLFVIDNSNSMIEEQERLREQFVELMLALDKFQGGFPNAHVGVISSDLGAGSNGAACNTPGGDNGCLQTMTVGACDGPSGKFIAITNDEGTLSGNIPDVSTPIRDGQGVITGCNDSAGADGVLDACDIAGSFSCVANLGTQGCGFEQHLESAYRALSDMNQGELACNGGFLRENALLAVVVLADEDDCSATDNRLFTGDPSLGPLESYRCFEFGTQCNEEITRTIGATYTGCEPREEADCPWPGGCYLRPISSYVDFFSTLKPPGKFIYAAIAGPWQPNDAVFIESEDGDPDVASSCNGGSAAPGIRLRALADALGEDGLYAPDLNASVCSASYLPALEELELRIHERLRPACLPSPLTDANGDLIESPSEAICTVDEVTALGTPEEEHDDLPMCVFETPRSDSLCPALDESAGIVENFPCWMLCDSSQLGEFGCDEIPDTDADRWQMRICRDELCDQTTGSDEPSVALVACATCIANETGCLCGDGACQDNEDSDNCAEDCE